MSFSEWREIKLGDLVEVSSSKRIYAKEYVDSGIPFYRSKEIIEKSKGNDVSTELYISKERFNELKNKFGAPSLGDILLTSVGTLGVPYIVRKEEFYFKDGNLTWIKNFKDNCHNKFIFYWLLSPDGVNQINTRCIGSTQKALTIDTLKKFELKIPPFEEQKAIAHILSTLDDKIEVNNQINRTLENMAQAIFKQWFVDFEFPNEDGEPYKSSGGEMVESELGMIPKGWEVSSIYSIADITYGAPFSSKLFNEDGEGLPLIRIRDLKLGNPQFYTTEEHKKGTIITPGDILIGMDAEFRPTIWSGKKAYLNQRVCQIKSNKNYIHDYYLYELIKPHMQFFEFSKVGTTVIHLGKSDIDSIKVIIPNTNYLESYSSIVDPLHDKLVSLSIENRKLRKIRDVLLPKLMSGEIRVPLNEEGDAS